MKNQNLPRLKNKSFFFLLIGLLLSQTACHSLFNIRKNFENSSAPETSQTSKKRRAEVPDLNSPSDAAEVEIYKLLLANNFDAIEKIANEARAKKERLPGGYWKIDTVYDGLLSMYGGNPDNEVTDEMWVKRIELFKQWKEKSPQSITARMALAEAYSGYGEFARGGGYIDTVSAENYKLLHERLDLALRELNEAKALNLKCPRWYREMLMIGMFKGWEIGEFEEVFDEAVNFEPNYLQFYLVKSEYLTPKWSGSQQEWEQFIETLPDRVAALGSDEANIIYFVVIVNKVKEQTLAINYRMFSRERIRHGFASLNKKYQTDNLRLNQYASIAVLTGDYAYAQEAFKQIGVARNGKVWSRQQFESMKNLADQQANTE